MLLTLPLTRERITIPDVFPRNKDTNEWYRVYAGIAIAAAENCIHVFEAEYPDDERPRRGASYGMARCGVAKNAANRREDILIDDPAWNNRLLCGCPTRLPGIRRVAVEARRRVPRL